MLELNGFTFAFSTEKKSLSTRSTIFTNTIHQPLIGKIDIENANISDFKSFGRIDKAVYYLDPKFPYLSTDNGNKIVFFGSDKSGKTIWFCRVALN